MKIKDLPKIDRPREEYPGTGHRKRLRERFSLKKVRLPVGR